MNLIKIGGIANTHGLKGTLKVKSFTDFKEERFKKGNKLFINFKGENIPVTVARFKSQKGLEHIDFEEYNDINQVEKFKGSELLISDEMVHSLPEDDFYFTELIGMDVYAEELIGSCIDVMEVPRGEILVVAREGKKNALIPFRKEFVEAVQKEENKIIVKQMEGLY